MKSLSRQLIFSTFLILVLSYGCKKEAPVPEFFFTGDRQPAPCEVTFTNQSTNFTSLRWEFGDGGMSTEINPRHIYATGGIFVVKLVAIGEGGEATYNTSLRILPPIPDPVADFIINGDATFAPRLVTFANVSTGADSFVWDFGDGATSSQVNVGHLYQTGGNYNVTLTARNSLNKASKMSKTVTILNEPTKLIIQEISITNMPFTNSNGGGWDLFDGPDVYVKISDSNNGNFFTSQTRMNQTPANLPITFTSSTSLVSLNGFDHQFSVEIWDYDNAIDSDYIFGYSFIIRNKMPTVGELYPSVIELQNPSYVTKFTLKVTWQ